MTSPYPEDFRKRVVAAVASKGLSRREAADLFQVAASTAIHWVKSWEETGSVAGKPTGGDKSSKIIGDDAEWVLALVRAKPDLTLVEIQTELRKQRRLEVSLAAVWRFLDKHGLRFKKSLHAAEQERPDVAAARILWRERQPPLDPERLYAPPPNEPSAVSGIGSAHSCNSSHHRNAETTSGMPDMPNLARKTL